MDIEKISNQLKEKLGGEDGPVESLTFEQLRDQLKIEIDSVSEDKMLMFDGIPFEIDQFQQFIETVGPPKVLVHFVSRFTPGWTENNEKHNTSKLTRWMKLQNWAKKTTPR